MRTRWLAAAMFALGAVVATAALLGPLVLGWLRYRTSDTTLNQLLGADAAALAVVVPWCAAVGVLAWRRHPAAAALALAPALYAAYTFTQVIVGQEYLRLPGNNERFFPLLLAGFMLGWSVAVGAWRTLDSRLPLPPPRLRRVTATVLVAVAVILTAKHIPSLIDAWRDQPTTVEYVSSPTPFWLVKLMDLGLVVPAALITAVGLARGREWARRPAYAIVGAYTLLGASVAGMGITMLVNDDPDAAAPVATVFTLFAVAFAALAGWLYRPLFDRPGRRRAAVAPVDPVPADGAPVDPVLGDGAPVDQVPAGRAPVDPASQDPVPAARR